MGKGRNSFASELIEKFAAVVAPMRIESDLLGIPMAWKRGSDINMQDCGFSAGYDGFDVAKGSRGD